MKILVMSILLILSAPCTTAYATEIGVAGISKSLDAADELPDPKAILIDNYIEKYSREYGIDQNLTASIILIESSGVIQSLNINSNGSRDYGLMQINSFNHNWLEDELGITDWYDPAQNIKAGCYMLGQLCRQYEDPHQVLMAYNMGPDQMRRLWRKGVRSSAYSRKVIKKYYELREGGA